MKTVKDIIEALEQARIDQRVNTYQMEIKAGLSRGHWHKVLHRRSRHLSIVTIAAAAEALNMQLTLQPKKGPDPRPEV